MFVSLGLSCFSFAVIDYQRRIDTGRLNMKYSIFESYIYIYMKNKHIRECIGN